MRPFHEGGGYWLYVPKPWNGRKCYGIPVGQVRTSKVERLLNIIEKLPSVKRRPIRDQRTSYSEGQSLFLLPKTLSKGIRHWNLYETRFKQWLKRISGDQPNTARADLSLDETPPINELSLLNHSYEEDPLRGYYTVWHMNTTKTSKAKLSTAEKVFEYINSVWKSRDVDRSLLKTPKGGVCGRIEDPSLLSAKGRDTLQRWSRIVSHYDAGNESGEDEDPVEMWNRSVEMSMLHASVVPSVTSNEAESSRKRRQDSSGNEADGEFEEPPLAASTALRPKLTATRRRSATGSAEGSPVAPKDVGGPDVNPVVVKSSSESRRRSPRVQVIGTLKNTPDGTSASSGNMVSTDGQETTSHSGCKENPSKRTTSPVVKNSTPKRRPTAPQSERCTLSAKISEVQTPSPKREAKTPLLSSNVTNSLRRRALLNSAIRRSRSAEKSSLTPLRRANQLKSAVAESATDTPKFGTATGKDVAKKEVMVKTSPVIPTSVRKTRIANCENQKTPRRDSTPKRKVTCRTPK